MNIIDTTHLWGIAIKLDVVNELLNETSHLDIEPELRQILCIGSINTDPTEVLHAINNLIYDVSSESTTLSLREIITSAHKSINRIMSTLTEGVFPKRVIYTNGYIIGVKNESRENI